MKKNLASGLRKNPLGLPFQGIPRALDGEESRRSRTSRARFFAPLGMTRVKGVSPQPAGWAGGHGSVLIISAPSGAGKSTLVRRLIASMPDLVFSISYTTRPPRQGEKEGRDYFFVTRRRFERMIAAGEFVEWAEVYGHLYGTSKAQIETALAAGRDVLLDIDVQGHQQVKKRIPEASSVFIMPPSFWELKRRLADRHSDSAQAVERRLAAARREIGHWPDYDYLVVNDRLSLATQALRAIARAGRFRRQNQAERAQEICKTFGG